jgi:uncharacterized delta-60 repeat protein
MLFSRKPSNPPRGRPHLSFQPRLEILEDRCLLSGGVLDPTFGSGGLVSTAVGVLSDAYAVATYPNAGTANDGKVVAVGDAAVTRGSNTYYEFAVARFNLNGTLDSSFGRTGEVTTILTTVQQGGAARDVAIQPDGKIVAAGYAAGSHQFAVVRYNPDGSLDASFGSQGIVLTNISKFSRDYAYSLGLQPDAKIVVAGITNPATVNAALAVVRYTSAGALDTSFGTGGKVTTQFASPLNSYARADLALDTSPLDPNAGKIVVVTRLETSLGAEDVVARYKANGTLDTAFAGGAGYETLSNLTLMPSVAVQADGHIIVAGGNGSSLELDRLNPDGSFDSTFGSGGIVAVNPPPNNPYYDDEDVTIQPDGKIVTTGPYHNTSTGAQDFLVARFNSADGSLDTSFGTGGVATVAAGSSISASKVSLALEPDGRIVAAGSLLTSTGGFALARFIAYGPQVGSFTASPNPVTAGSNLTLTASNITDANPGATITQVAFYYSNSSGTKVTLGTITVSSGGAWTLTSATTFGLTAGTYTLYAQAEDSYGVFGDPLALTPDRPVGRGHFHRATSPELAKMSRVAGQAGGILSGSFRGCFPEPPGAADARSHPYPVGPRPRRPKRRRAAFAAGLR